MQNRLSVISFLSTVNALLLLFSVNSNAQTINLNDSLQINQPIKKDGLDESVLTPFMAAFSGKTLLSGLTVNEGRIISEGMLQVTGSTTFTLSNGIKVHYKFVDKNKNNIQLKAISYGGFSLVKDCDLPSAEMLSRVVSSSGLGNHSASDLSKVLVGKIANTSIRISDLTESISGFSTTKDIETLLQMIYLRFVKPRFDNDAYRVLIRNLKNDIIEKRSIINDRINDSVTTTLYGSNNPKRRLLNKDFIKEVSFDKIKALYMERFGNVTDFEFFIVGDIQKGALRSLLEKYLGSIPTKKDVKEIWKDNSTSWLHDAIHKEIPLIMETPKSFIRMGYNSVIGYSLKNELIVRFLEDILQLRLIEEASKDQENTNISVKARMSKRPIERASLDLIFDCNPGMVDKLIAMVYDEIENIAKGFIEQTDLDKTKSNYLKERKEQQNCNSYDMGILINYFREGHSMTDFEDFEKMITTITIKDIEVFTKELMKDSKSYKIIFSPDRT